MNQKELKELIEFLIEKDIAEFELERGDVKVKIKRACQHTVVQAGAEVPYVAAAVPQTAQPAGGCDLGCRTPGSAGRASSGRKPAHRKVSHRGDALRSALAGLAAFRQGRGHGGSGTGAVHCRGDETAE